MTGQIPSCQVKLSCLNVDYDKSVLEDNLVVTKPTVQNITKFFREDNKELYLLLEASPDVKYVGFGNVLGSRVERYVSDSDEIIILDPIAKTYDLITPAVGLDSLRFQAFPLFPQRFFEDTGYQSINKDYQHWLFIDTKNLDNFRQTNEELFDVFRNCQEINLHLSSLSKLIGFKFIDYYDGIVLLNPHRNNIHLTKDAVSFSSFCVTPEEVVFSDFENFLDKHLFFKKSHEKYTTEFVSEDEIYIKRNYEVHADEFGTAQYVINPLSSNQGEAITKLKNLMSQSASPDEEPKVDNVDDTEISP